MLPLIILCGQAGSGKDTVASFMVKNHAAIAVSQADPMKRFVFEVFGSAGFDHEVLWGPSWQRNRMIPLTDAQFEAVKKIYDVKKHNFVKEVLDPSGETEHWQAVEQLDVWFTWMISKAGLECGISARTLLQTLGTEWGRTVKKNIWVDYTAKIAVKLLSGGYNYSATVGLISGDKNPSFVVITDGRFRNEIISVKEMGGVAWRIASETDAEATERAGIAGHASEAEQKLIPDHFYDRIFVNSKSLGLESCEKRVQVCLDDQFPVKWIWM